MPSKLILSPYPVLRQPIDDRDSQTLRIPLGGSVPGCFATIDLVDIERVVRRNWYRGGTAQRPVPMAEIRGSSRALGRFIVDSIPGDRVTYCDGDPLNCRRENLRHAQTGSIRNWSERDGLLGERRALLGRLPDMYAGLRSGRSRYSERQVAVLESRLRRVENMIVSIE